MEHQQQQDESCCVPPGFRFHPTEEELVGYYLARKVASQKIDLDIIQEVDLYRMEPWDLQERCGRQYSTGQDEDFRSSSSSAAAAEWYFFSFKDRKYPSGTRTNRATAAGFWKATGRDKPVLSSSSSSGRRGAVIGMRKTLVFYRGRAPNGRKTEWIMHEYRLQSSEHAPTPEEGWVVCRAFHKPVPNMQMQHRPLPFVFPGAEHYAAAAGSPAGYYINDIDARLNGHGHGHGGDLLHYLHPAAAASNSGGGFVFPGNGNGQLIGSEDLVDSKKHLNILSSSGSIPQLIESPATTAAAAIDENDQISGQQAAAGAIDWNFLDSLLSSSTSSQLIHDSSSQLMMHLQQQH